MPCWWWTPGLYKTKCSQALFCSYCLINVRLQVSPGEVLVYSHGPGQRWVSGCGQWGGTYRLAATHVGAYMIVLMWRISWRKMHKIKKCLISPQNITFKTFLAHNWINVIDEYLKSNFADYVTDCHIITSTVSQSLDILTLTVIQCLT